ncbi:hypothetical protein QYF61_000026, partial [Mycteria americana]
MNSLALVTNRSSIASPLVGLSITWVKKLSSMHSKSLLGCLQLAMLLFQQMLGDGDSTTSTPWNHHHRWNQPVPMLDNTFSEDIFPNIQPKPPLAQLEAISSHAITCCLGEETNTHLATTSFQVVLEHDKVFPEAPFLQAKQPQFPQPILIRFIRLIKAPSNLALNTSREGVSTTFLGNLFQCRTTLTVKNFFLISNLNLPSFSLKLLPLILSLRSLTKILEGCYRVSLEPSLLQAKQSQLSQPVLLGEVFQPQ